MSISLTEDFRTLDELKESPEAIVRQVQNSENGVVVTVKGKPAAVMLGVKQYEWLVHLVNFSRLIHEGEADIRAGRVRPIEEFIRELEDEGKLPRRSRGRRRSRPARKS